MISSGSMATASRASGEGLFGFACGEELVGALGAAEGGGLLHGEVAAVDEDAVVDHLGGFERLEVAVGIHAAAGPLAAAEVAGAEEDRAVDVRAG